jgi:hypothetical protein
MFVIPLSTVRTLWCTDLFLCAPLRCALACGAREFLLAVLIGTTSQAFGRKLPLA